MSPTARDLFFALKLLKYHQANVNRLIQTLESRVLVKSTQKPKVKQFQLGHVAISKAKGSIEDPQIRASEIIAAATRDAAQQGALATKYAADQGARATRYSAELGLVLAIAGIITAYAALRDKKLSEAAGRSEKEVGELRQQASQLNQVCADQAQRIKQLAEADKFLKSCQQSFFCSTIMKAGLKDGDAKALFGTQQKH